MKLIRLKSLFVAALLSSLNALGQGSASNPGGGLPPQGAAGIAPNLIDDPDLGMWKSTIADWHSTRWQRTVVETNPVTGELTPYVHHYTELGGGLNFIDSFGAWQRSLDVITISTNGGGAEAVFGPTKVHFNPSLGLDGPTIQITTASNTVIHIEPFAVYYVDDSGAAVLISNLRPAAEGELIPPNRVVYRAVSTNGFACDVVYTYTHGAFESDLVILTQPSITPEMVGLDPASARLSLVHLVTGAVPATKMHPTAGGLVDTHLSFPGLTFPEGFAFQVGEDSAMAPDSPAPVNVPAGPIDGNRVSVVKRVIPIRGLQWGLAEDVRWEDIKPMLEQLPAQRHGAAAPSERRASLELQLPRRTADASHASKPMRVANLRYRPRGVDLDFITIANGSAYTFASGETYFLSSSATFTGTVDIYGSCVVKETNGASLTLSGPVNCWGSAFNPSIFTSANDWAFGEIGLPGSTGYPSGAGNPALHLTYTNSPPVLNGLKIRWAQTALQVDGSTGITFALTNSSIEWCTNGVNVNGGTENLTSSSKCNVTTPTYGSGTVVGSLSDECSGNDSNGLPKSWEFAYFGQLGINANADPDSDGLNNSTEYSLGTNPQVCDAPRVQNQPQDQTVVLGGTATFNVVATGTGTLTYQWYRAGVPISGATASSYSMSNVQYTNCTTYFVIVTNAYGMFSSGPAFLSVAVPTNGVPCPSGIVAWWPGNGNANDVIGTNNGTIGNSYTTAKVGQGFNIQNSSTVIRIPAAPTLNVGTNNGFTIEGWIDPYDTTGRPIIEWAPTNSYGVHVWANFITAGAVWINIADVGGNSHTFQSASLLTANTFQHLAVTYDKTSGYLQLFLNGVLKTNYFIGVVAPQTSSDLWLGCRPSSGATFNGIIDEMSLYNRVLTAAEIASISGAAGYGKLLATAPAITQYTAPGSWVDQGSTTNFTVTASGTGPLVYTWTFNGVIIAGATTSMCTVTNVQLTNEGNYAVVVANVAGSVLSRNFDLLVNNHCSGLASGILDWWRAEQNALDQVGTNNGQWVGTATYTNGWVAQAFSFPGTSGNYVQIPNSPTLQLTNAFTIEFWCKDSGLGSGVYGGLIAKRPSTGPCNFGVTLIGGSPKDTLLVYLLDTNYNNGNYQAMTCTSAFPNDGNFHHIAVTYNQTNSTNIVVQAYVDGTFISAQTLYGNLANTLNSSPVTIGASNSGGEWFHGVIDELSIYSRVLDYLAIGSIALTGSQGKCYFPPQIVIQPNSQTVLQGSTPLLAVGSIGDNPLLTQFYFNGNAIPGATSWGGGYWITNIQPNQAGDYFAVVSNIVGRATSVVASISVLSPPSIIVQPAPQAAPIGANVTFTVVAAGTPPLMYQWNQDGVPIQGAVSNVFNIPSVQLTNFGNYSVQIANAGGTVLSTNAALSYSGPCFPAPSGALAWWSAESTANDIIGTNNGTFAGVYTNGEVNKGFTVTSASTAVRVPATPSLNVGTNGGFTIEGWINNYDNSGRSIFEWAPTNTYGVHVWANYPSSGGVYANIVDTSGFNHTLQTSSALFTANAFVHVAVTYDKTSGTAKIYVNGALGISTFIGSFTPQTTPDFWIGCRPSNVNGTATPFNGVLDEVTLYNRALTYTEIQSIYYATASGKCSSEPANNMVVTITTPTNMQQFLQPANVPLQAMLSDNAGTNVTVKFYYDTNLIGVATQASTNGAFYNLTWPTNWGTYSITAVATDNAGVSNVSYPRIFVVNPTNNVPVVNITYPTANSIFPAGTDLTITATASSGVGGGAVTNVLFYVNGMLLGSDSQAPYSIRKCCWSSGMYQLTAVAMDNFGMSGVTATPIKITVGPVNEGSANGFWDPLFGNPGVGSSAPITAMCVQSNILYASGGPSFSMNGTPIYSIGKWDGAQWVDMDNTNPISVYVHAIVTDGTNVYAGGEPASGETRTICKWDGAEWVQVGDYVGGFVRAITIMGSDIYIGGDSLQLPGGILTNLARLNPTNSHWEAVGNGLNGSIFALATVGGQLYAGGVFTGAGGNTNANGIAKLVGNTWTNLGSGVVGTNYFGQAAGVFCLASCGNNLFVGGDFITAGGNTNANGIAKWDGANWTTIGNGLLGTDNGDTTPVYIGSANNLTFCALHVSAIVAQGSSIFAGGEFTYARQGTNLAVNHIARADWSESKQTWTWDDLDQGVTSGGFGDDFVVSLAVMNGASPGAYDLFAGGLFSSAGSAGTFSRSLGRWSVGKQYPSTNQTVTITSPVNGALFTNPPTTTITFNAITKATNSGSTTVEFFVDGTSLGVIGSPPFTANWSATVGAHIVTAVVSDNTVANDFRAAAVPVTFNVKPSNTSTVTAVDDSFVVFANSGPNYLPVLANDQPSSGLKIKDASPSIEGAFGRPVISALGVPAIGSVSVSFDQQYVVYTPIPNWFGTNILAYSITNSSGSSDHGYATVKIAAQPFVVITNPPTPTITTNSASLTISGTVVDFDGTVSNLKILTNGVTWASWAPSGTTFNTNWTQSNPGFYTFRAVATDNDGYTNMSPPVVVEIKAISTNANPPIAIISSPTPVVTNMGSLRFTNVYVVRDGQLALSGSAYSPDTGAAIAWQTILVDPQTGTNTLYNLTQGTLNAQGFATNVVYNGSFGTNLDLSLVQNGTYLLELVVQSEGLQTIAALLIQVESNAKIGQFSFSEQDLVIPVSGIPLTVTRTYNSLNPLSSDFGYAWTFAINDMDVQLDEQRTSVVIGSPQALFAEQEEDATGAPLVASIRTGGSSDVTLTLPDGRRATFAFSPYPGTVNAYARWVAPPGVYATLTNYPFGANLINYFPLAWASSDFSLGPEPFTSHDVPGWMLRTQDGTQYYITRGTRNTVTYDIDGQGTWRDIQTYGPPKLTSIVQPSGDTIVIGTNSIYHQNKSGTNTHTIWFERDGQNRITAIHDPTGGSSGTPVVKYIYNNDTGNLIQVLKLTDRVAGIYATNRYFYSNPQFPHYITEIDNANGVPSLMNYYDSSGRLIYTVDANYHTNSFVYNLTNSLEVATDRRGNPTTYVYDLRGNVTAITNALNGVTLASYDGANNKTNEVVLLNGTPYATNNFTYDPNTGLLLTSVNSLGFSNSVAYNWFGQVTNTVDALNRSSTNFYDLNTGNLLGTVDALSGTTTNVYDTNSLLISATDSAGAVTTNQYDSLGNLTFTQTGYYSNNTFVALTSMRYGYDSDGNCLAATNGLNVVTRFGFDGQNRIIATTNAWATTDQTVTWTIYDAIGRVAQTVDALGVTNVFGYDFLNRRTTLTRALGTSVQQTIQTGYDAEGNRTQQIDNLGRETDFQYDALNRQTVTLFPAATSGAARTGITNAYDGLNRGIAVTNQAGVGTGFQFDVLSRLITVTNALGKLTQYQWDSVGNETNQIDSLTHSTKFSYDALNRRTQRTIPGTQAQKFGYDSGSRLISQTNFDGTIITNQYDVLGRLVKRCNGATVLETYAYSAMGHLTNRTDASGTYNWVYDNLGRLKTNSTPVGTLYYTYDANGNLLTLSSATANGVSLTYQYDAVNRVTNVIDNRLTGTKNTGYAFDGVGNLQSLNYPNGLTNLWQYDPLNRLTNLTWKLSGAQRGDFAYQLGTAGNRTNLVDTVNGTSRTFSWGYDNLYRLTNETISGGSPTGTLGYGYDDVANRTSRTGTIGGLTASNNTFDVNDWTSGLVFDANGNTRTNGSIYYGYDWANRLTSQTNGSAVVSIVYDADGNRIQKATTTAATLYLVATVNPSGNPQVVEEFTVSGGVTNLSKVYSYGLQLISQRQVSSGTVNFYGYDGHGSTRFLTSTNATITDTYTYDAYGTLIASTGSTANNYLYCGEQWDPELGLYYLRARYYLPTLGRFWTMDSFEGKNRDPLSLHKYVFVEDNPVNKIDPTGLNGDEISLLATINTMVRVAATYVSRMPVAARAAFAAGGSTLGAFFNQIGQQVEQWGAEVIEMFPQIETEANAVLQGFSRRPDWLLRVGNTLRLLEAKYQLPSAGPALTRIGSQIQQYSQWAGQGPGREVVVWALKNPQNAATAEQTVLQAAGNPQGVRFVYGVRGLYDYLTQWVN